MTVSYDGEPFHGFQRQEGLPTVQGAVENALSIACRRPVHVAGAGRTDTGVHALGQVVSFEWTCSDPDPASLARSVSAIAGPSISVTATRVALPDADARFSAQWREYRYLIADTPHAPVFLRTTSWWLKRDLDVEAMQAAGTTLLGRHDFTSFCVSACLEEGRSPVRTIDALEIERISEMGEPCVSVTIRARSFLHSQVRIVVGTLVDVGLGSRDITDMEVVLQARDRACAGQTAPARGLTLMNVGYPAEIFEPAV